MRLYSTLIFVFLTVIEIQPSKSGEFSDKILYGYFFTLPVDISRTVNDME